MITDDCGTTMEIAAHIERGVSLAPGETEICCAVGGCPPSSWDAPITARGLVTPHMVRLWIGPDHRILIPVSLLFGAILLVMADLASRVLPAPNECPIGIITALSGAPFFAYLLGRRGRGVCQSSRRGISGSRSDERWC